MARATTARATAAAATAAPRATGIFLCLLVVVGAASALIPPPTGGRRRRTATLASPLRLPSPISHLRPLRASALNSDDDDGGRNGGAADDDDDGKKKRPRTWAGDRFGNSALRSVQSLASSVNRAGRDAVYNLNPADLEDDLDGTTFDYSVKSTGNTGSLVRTIVPTT
eukprot:CAMPEP_0113541916 /NCGR_PEP_ID=MMETSP0015_2-20120614/9311_1 /TAXON_ID=2838 /ORGANISM="Odontella" /LENGTH=167 /DNA_ID=CAMNT_0000441903 /DNA_START=80 /DNA_END=579 /DNA_ORIENTATION=+ /assembly_acc=CAM_ASM_000160